MNMFKKIPASSDRQDRKKIYQKRYITSVLFENKSA